MRKKSKRFILEVNEAQATVIRDALEIYARLGIGQWSYCDMFFYGLSDTHKAREHFKALEELDKNKNKGISNADSQYQVAWDIYQCVRAPLAWDQNPKGGITVDFREPMRFSNEPLPKVEVVK